MINKNMTENFPENWRQSLNSYTCLKSNKISYIPKILVMGVVV